MRTLRRDYSGRPVHARTHTHTHTHTHTYTHTRTYTHTTNSFFEFDIASWRAQLAAPAARRQARSKGHSLGSPRCAYYQKMKNDSRLTYTLAALATRRGARSQSHPLMRAHAVNTFAASHEPEAPSASVRSPAARQRKARSVANRLHAAPAKPTDETRRHERRASDELKRREDSQGNRHANGRGKRIPG